MTLQNEIEKILNDCYYEDWVANDGDDSYEQGYNEDKLIKQLSTLISSERRDAVRGFVRECIEARLEFKDFDTRKRFEEILNEYLDSAKPNEKVETPEITISPLGKELLGFNSTDERSK